MENLPAPAVFIGDDQFQSRITGHKIQADCYKAWFFFKAVFAILYIVIEFNASQELF